MRGDLEAAIDEPPDVDEGESADRIAGCRSVLCISGGRRERLLQQQILAELAEVRQLHSDQVLHEAGVEARLKLRTALEPEVGIAGVERHGTRGNPAGVQIRQRL